jgi:broad specificity phosphatase PhoE
MHQAELVVVSPLTRALQTACYIFSHACDREAVPSNLMHMPPFICHPAVAEVGGIPENHARPLAALCKDKDLTRLERFTAVDFSLIEAEDTWPPTARPHKTRTGAAQTFLSWLNARPEKVIVLVSHHNFLQGLLRTTASVPNCMPIVVAVDTEGEVKRVAGFSAPQ